MAAGEARTRPRRYRAPFPRVALARTGFARFAWARAGFVAFAFARAGLVVLAFARVGLVVLAFARVGFGRGRVETGAGLAPSPAGGGLVERRGWLTVNFGPRTLRSERIAVSRGSTASLKITT